MYWGISPPKVTPVGFANLTREVFYGPVTTPVPNPGASGSNPGVPSQISHEATQSNTLDTSNIPVQFSMRQRYEFGRVEDHNVGSSAFTRYAIRSRISRFLQRTLSSKMRRLDRRGCSTFKAGCPPSGPKATCR